MYRVPFLVGGLLATLFALTSARAAPEIDILSYDLSLKIPFEERGFARNQNRLEGRAVIVFENTGEDALTVVPLLLNRLMHITAAETAGGTSLEISERLTALDDWPAFHAVAYEIRLANPLPAGKTLELTLEYGGLLVGYSETGMQYVQETLDPEFTIIRSEALSYPQVSPPKWEALRVRWRDEFERSFSVTVPKGHVVASGDILIDQHNDGDDSFWSYKGRAPDSVFLFTVAPYATILVDGVRIFHFPEDQTGAAQVAEAVAFSLETYGKWFGRRRTTGEGLALIEIPEGFGSQAISPTIIQTADAFQDAHQMTQAYHELSHLWNVQDLDLPSPRWNEGLAMFLQYLMAQEAGEQGALNAGIDRALDRARRSVADNRHIAMSEYGVEGVTGLSYSVGPIFFGILYDIMGREVFFATYRDFLSRHRESGASTDDFLMELEAAGGPEVKILIEKWFRSTAYWEQVEAADNFEEILVNYR